MNKGRLEDQLKISCAEYQDVTIYKNEYAVQHQTYCLPHSPLRKKDNYALNPKERWKALNNLIPFSSNNCKNRSKMEWITS